MAGRTFASDNYAGIHPAVLTAITAANQGHLPSYGSDPVTVAAERLFAEHFGAETQVLFVFNGTGANVVGLQTMLRPFQSVVCAASAHIYNDECGAPERYLGSKLVPVAAPGGKLTPALVERAIASRGDQHRAQARVVSISQSSEVGTTYTVEEVKALADWAHDHEMLLHVDGARLANAAAFLGANLGDLGAAAGVDVLSFGGTKNGAMGAEAVILFRPETQEHALYTRKQAMQLGSKMRFISAQFIALLAESLWRQNAEHANTMAQYLAASVADIPGVTVSHPVEANAVFAAVPAAVTAELQRDFPFYVWDELTGEVRWMASWDTTEDDVDAFVARLRALSEAIA